MFVAQCLEARVNKSANSPYSSIAKVNREHPPSAGYPAASASSLNTLLSISSVA